MEEGLLKNTGKPLDHWVKVVKKAGIDKHRAIINFLKEEHGFSYGFANFVAHKTLKSDAGSSNADDLIAAQYQNKADLKPIYDKLLKVVSKLGKDVVISPKKSAVSIVRKKQFALIKPATKTRIDLGLKLKGKANTERLGDSGPFGSMCSHRVQLTDIKEVDKELIAWLKEAYQGAE